VSLFQFPKNEILREKWAYKMAYIDLPETELVNLKSKGGLVHPNINLFYFLSKV